MLIATEPGALYSNTLGNYNTADGVSALGSNTTGSGNAGIGYQALNQNSVGSGNSALGTQADVTLGNLVMSTAIGFNALVNGNNKLRLGSATTTVVEAPVVYTVSDGRFKFNISEGDVKGLEYINRLRPVVYNFDTKRFTEHLTQNMPDEARQRYMKDDFGPSTAIRHSGFIAQEVDAAARQVGYEFNGVHIPRNSTDNYSLSYSQLIVPLVKAVQEQQQQMQRQQQQITELKQLAASLTNIRKN